MRTQSSTLKSRKVKKPISNGRARAKSGADIAPSSDTQLALLSDLNYDVLTSLAGFWIRRAELVVMRSFFQHIEDMSLRPVEAAALVLIGANKMLSQNVLAAALGTDQATLVAISTRLEGQALILRERLTTDRRYQVLSLTADGKKAVLVINARLKLHNENILKGLSKTQRKQLVSMLRTVVQGEM